jgi:DNA-binding NtrC family response regulator
MRAIYEQAGRAAQSPISVLILGETGVGKEVLARAIHARSPRAKKPFMAMNLAELGEAMLEGELFGYEKGAFTGAVQSRAGLLEAANGGTVFLDEIGELPPAVQVKLLRVLEERAVRRLGERQPRSIDVRFVAATHRDLEAQIREGRFREDLYFRLNGMTLVIPPLRERRDEIEPLARSFAQAACRELNRATTSAVSDEAMTLLKQHAWPGNVRELRNVIDRAMALCTTTLVLPEHLPTHLLAARSAATAAAPAAAEPSPDP